MTECTKGSCLQSRGAVLPLSGGGVCGSAERFALADALDEVVGTMFSLAFRPGALRSGDRDADLVGLRRRIKGDLRRRGRGGESADGTLGGAGRAPVAARRSAAARRSRKDRRILGGDESRSSVLVIDWIVFPRPMPSNVMECRSSAALTASLRAERDIAVRTRSVRFRTAEPLEV